ncbi:MAG: NYN domain-containing protein [Corynebacterium sp.]|nr:NYN domain-containing protein [Corynebacterium sp.]
MLERTLVFVDTSYLLASFYNSWEIGARAQLEIDLPEVVATLKGMVETQLNQPIQRQYWYDGIPDAGPHRYQRALRSADGVMLRVGQLIEWGERRTQKAVDTRLVADMVLAGVRGTCSDAVLVSGDADMIPGVHELSNSGVRVHLYGFGWDSMSSALRHACDSVTILDPREAFADCMQVHVLEGPLPPNVHVPGEGIPPEPIGDATPIFEGGSTPVPGPTGSRSDATATAATDSAESGEDAAALEGTPNQDSVDAASAPGPSTDSPVAPSATSDPSTPADSPAPADSPTATSATSLGAPGTSATSAAGSAAPLRSLRPGEPAEDTDVVSSLTDPGTHVGSARDDADDDGQTPADESSPVPGSATGGAQASVDGDATATGADQASDSTGEETPAKPKPNPSMMAPRRKLQSRYVPLPNEVWASAGYQTPFDVGQQYAVWWYENAATSEQRDQAHLLSGGGLPPEVDRPLLQFACDTLHEYTLSETQRVQLRDGFHHGIRGVLINRPR